MVGRDSRAAIARLILASRVRRLNGLLQPPGAGVSDGGLSARGMSPWGGATALVQEEGGGLERLTAGRDGFN